MLSAVRSAGFYQGVLKNAIQKLKYDGDLALGESLAKLLLKINFQQSWNIDLITCVPLDKKRYRERGYNQSAYLAGSLAHMAGLPYSGKAINRVKHTRPQVGLSMIRRMENVSDAFAANINVVTGKTILLVDDVITTGATLNSCAIALLKAEAAKVFGLTLARAERLLEE